MYKGYKEDNRRMGELAIYLELLKQLESFEEHFADHGMSSDVFIIIITRMGLLLDVIKATGTVSEQNKRQIIKAVNEQIKLLLEVYNRDKEGKGPDGK